MRRVLIWIFRSVLGVITLVLLAAAGFLGLAAWDFHQTVLNQHGKLDSQRPFIKSGSSYRSASTRVDQTFSVEKSSSEFRVFVLGSSEAMGAPYVLPRFHVLSGHFFGMPNEGGISTWIAKYLERLLPASSVKVVNAANGGFDLQKTVETMKEVLEVGSPDAIVILEGNNERPDVDGFRVRDGADLQDVLDRLSDHFELQLSSAARLARAYRVPTYVLTVPNNIRDWLPQDQAGGGPSNAANPGYWAKLGREQEDRRQYEAARRSYIRAKDLDYDFGRTRSRWNESIRRLRGPYVHVIDMERIMFGYAPNGIPGGTLFHDACHMSLAANRTVAFEVVKRLGADRGWREKPIALADVSPNLFTRGQLRCFFLLKAFRWMTAKWMREGWDSAEAPMVFRNAEWTARQYLLDAKRLDQPDAARR